MDETEIPNPFMPGNTKPGTQLGDYVIDYRGRIGRVSDAHYGCPEGPDWMAAQSYEVKRAMLETHRWVSVLLHEGGAIVAPETLFEPTEPFVLKNNHALLLWTDVARER